MGSEESLASSCHKMGTGRGHNYDQENDIGLCCCEYLNADGERYSLRVLDRCDPFMRCLSATICGTHPPQCSKWRFTPGSQVSHSCSLLWLWSSWQSSWQTFCWARTFGGTFNKHWRLVWYTFSGLQCRRNHHSNWGQAKASFQGWSP